MQYVSTDLNKVKDNWNWQSVTNLSALQITPNKEMLYEEEQHLDLQNLSDELSLSRNASRLSDSSTVTGTELNFVPQVAKLFQIDATDKTDGHILQELERQPELHEIELKNEHPSDTVNLISSSSSSPCIKFLATLSGSSRELSVISEHSDPYAVSFC
ncbi:unnamed protein product [Wuchereria bancrofti]|uniref:Uncharacterized protein n=1 Tax=Wuchereria bancrofti TaxID=6293 RepID=A0A3P7E293_WUCBA|nr:unnamed protein product [Wuchereria bancrofti]